MVSSTGAKSVFDFIVVGGGNSGAIIASKLAESQAKPKVLLIEAGGENTDHELRIAGERFLNVYKQPELRFNYQTIPQPALDGRVLPYLRGRGLGGSSIANYLAYMRGSSKDYDLWAELVGDDAFKWENILEEYKALEHLHFDGDKLSDSFVCPATGKHGFDGPVDIEVPSPSRWAKGMDILINAATEFGFPINPDQNSGNPIGVGVVHTTSHKGFRITSASAYLMKRPPNLTIWTQATVTELLMDDQPSSGQQRITGVRLMDGRETTSTKEVILSAGVIDTPKLLLVNGIGPVSELARLDIKPVLNLPGVGKNLSDHCYTVMSWGADSDLSDVAQFNCTPSVVYAAREQWLKDHTGDLATRNLPNLAGFLKLPPERYSSTELDKFDPTFKTYLQHPMVPQYEIFFGGPPPMDIELREGEEYFDVGIGMMPPQSRGSVTLASKDPNSPPLIDSKFLTHPYDRRTFIDAIREFFSFMKSPAIARHIRRTIAVPKSDSDEDILSFLRETVLSVLHGCGTVKMGKEDDPMACVDTSFRLRGLAGLRVVDLSIAPVLTNNHTQATAYVVAQVAWKKLAEEYNL